MKTILSVFILTILTTISLLAQTESKQQPMDHQKHMQMMEMLKDSSMMDMMMSHVAADRHMRMRMMEKMAEQTEGNKEAMQELCKMMMKGKSVQSGEQKSGCGMMMHDTMQESDANKEKKENEDQHKLHKH